MVANTIEKMKRLSDADFYKLDLKPYKQKPEQVMGAEMERNQK